MQTYEQAQAQLSAAVETLEVLLAESVADLAKAVARTGCATPSEAIALAKAGDKSGSGYVTMAGFVTDLSLKLHHARLAAKVVA